MNYLSHPGKHLTEHISNIAAYDSDPLFQTAVMFHDFGKITDSFQHYITSPETSRADPHAFVSGVAFLLNGSKKLTCQESVFIFNAIISHHGRLKSLKTIKESLFEIDDPKMKLSKIQLDEIAAKQDAAEYFGLANCDMSELEDLAFEYDDLTFDIDDYVNQKSLFSKLIFADKYEVIFSKSYKHKPLNFAIQKFYDFKARLSANIERENAKNSIFEIFHQVPEKKIYTITAPTGIGKTLISLELALTIAEIQNRQRVIYTIPFTSIIDQTAEVFESIFPGQITKHHHKAVYKTQDEEGKNNYDRVKFLVESWGEPFIVSTFYQLFFCFFSNENSENIKFQSLQNSVVVMDEVQAIPFELWKVMQELFPVFADKLNITFVLMSATLPIVTKKVNELANKKVLFGAKNRYRLEYLVFNAETEDEKLVELKEAIREQFDMGKSVLCVVNTIKNAKKLFKLLSDELNEEIYCLNSYMLPSDRTSTVHALKEIESNNVKHKILISTQVIEAGVDLDFDIGFRELSPLSSIIQTAGRVNREGLANQAILFVFDTLSYVIYDGSLMTATKNHIITALRNDTIEEKEILSFVERYFNNLDTTLSDREKILESIKRFDFDAIDKSLKEIFKVENDYTVSVLLGYDLKAQEQAYCEKAVTFGKWELKTYKEQQFKRFVDSIVNIKKKDLEHCGVNVSKSEIFGLSYIEKSESVYSQKSGFLIEEERDSSVSFF